MNPNTLEFDLGKADHVISFARLCNALNEAGTPYTTQHEMGINHVALTISTGY